MSEQLSIGQRIIVHTPTASGGILNQNATVKGYEGDELLVRFDHQGYVVRLPLDWKIDLIPGEPVSHWQVWEVSRSDRLLKDNLETPLQAEFFLKQQKEEYHQVASRHDDWVPPPQFEIRAVPMEGDRLFKFLHTQKTKILARQIIFLEKPWVVLLKNLCNIQS